MARLLITYSLSYDWLVNGRPEAWQEPSDGWREPYAQGLAYQAAARAAWEPHDAAVFAAFESFGLRFWEAWPAYPVLLPEGVRDFKDPLTFQRNVNWEETRTLLVHELCHLHEDHPLNRARYEAVLAHIREAFPDEEEGVQYHLITCTLQQAVLLRAFPDRWRAMLGYAKGRHLNPADVHPVLRRTWELIEQREATIDWTDPLRSLASFV